MHDSVLIHLVDDDRDRDGGQIDLISLNHEVSTCSSKTFMNREEFCINLLLFKSRTNTRVFHPWLYDSEESRWFIIRASLLSRRPWGNRQK